MAVLGPGGGSKAIRMAQSISAASSRLQKFRSSSRTPPNKKGRLRVTPNSAITRREYTTDEKYQGPDLASDRSLDGGEASHERYE